MKNKQLKDLETKEDNILADQIDMMIAEHEKKNPTTNFKCKLVTDDIAK